MNNQTKKNPECGARTHQGPCSRPPLGGKQRCRLHGGLSPGAPKGDRNGNYTEGNWTREAYAERRWLRSLIVEHIHLNDDSRAIIGTVTIQKK